jgi:hypothetical protein
MRLTRCLTLLILLGLWLPHAMADDLNRLLHDAASGSQAIRLQALQALGNSGDVRALQPLLTALDDRDPTIRSCAIAALRALARTLDGIYRTIAQWINTLLASLQIHTSPPPPEVEHTRHLRYI